MGQRETPGYCHAMARDCERAALSAATVELRTSLRSQAATWWRLAGEPPGYGCSQAMGGTPVTSASRRPATVSGGTHS